MREKGLRLLKPVRRVGFTMDIQDGLKMDIQDGQDNKKYSEITQAMIRCTFIVVNKPGAAFVESVYED